MAAEASFYHLTRSSLDEAAPTMLERCVARDWRVTFRFGSRERAAAMTALLWTWRDEAFLPHGDATDPHPDRQPIYLTAGPETPNAPCTLFLADCAEPTDAELARMLRVVSLFDGRDEAAVVHARGQWLRAVAAGCRCVYRAQGAEGWEVRREHDPAKKGAEAD